MTTLKDKEIPADNKNQDNGFCWSKDVKEKVLEFEKEFKNLKEIILDELKPENKEYSNIKIYLNSFEKIIKNKIFGNF